MSSMSSSESDKTSSGRFRRVFKTAQLVLEFFAVEVGLTIIISELLKHLSSSRKFR